MDTSYCLAPGRVLVDRPPLADASYTAGLADSESDEILLLNAELAALLRQFVRPASVADAARIFATQAEASPADIQAVVQTAVDAFVRQGILVTDERLREQEAYPFPSLPPGMVFSGYTIREALSASPPVGIYLASDQVGKRCILKKLFVHPAASPTTAQGQRNEFTYEFDILAHLRGCPGVPKLLHFDPDEPIGVVDYFTGMSLRQFVPTDPQALPLPMRMLLFRRLLRAVAGLHRRDVLHGDLHNDNVLVSRTGRVRLIDFDLALFGRDRQKKNAHFGGITDFIAPEQLTDNVFRQSVGAPDFRAEVYQIGVLGYFIFHGKLPFVRHTWRTKVAAIRSAAPLWEADAPTATKEIIEMAMQKNPARRFASAIAMQSVATKTARTSDGSL